MRRWNKYWLDPAGKGVKYARQDSSFEEHSKGMGYYNADDAYSNRQEFFKKYFFGYQNSRLEYYDKFLRKHLDRSWDILSVGSGRCANELFLGEDGFKITCSDLELIQAFERTKNIFPELDFIKLDILASCAPKQFDCLVSLSLIYLFDGRELDTFFRNSRKSLKKGGFLLLDSAGSPDNLLSFLINDIFLKAEANFLRLMKFISTGSQPGLLVKRHGWRRTDNEIIAAAKRNGFEIIEREYYSFFNEFRRSAIYARAVPCGSAMELVFEPLGRRIPYVRMFKFRKKGE